MDGPLDSAQCTQLIRLSCAKIVSARTQKGGAKLHRNLLIINMLRRAKDFQNKLDEAHTPFFVDSDDDDDEETVPKPPLEFSVTDSSDVELESDEPLAFACEATEEESQQTPISDDALSRLADRKRKADVRPQPRKKTFKSASDRTVPQLLRVVPCK